ncbi:MAG: LytTR family DNA-binding domain-containing protein [Bacteroidota bacterium]|nr:LytTR family DNA-binding domain-containing protein [Bacteroidota bacterium]
MITAVIIDDEINKANYLKAILEKNIPSVILKGIATNAENGIKLILSVQPKLVFLDIELQTSTGFDLLNQIKDINFSVIFTTAHEHYALKAIKFAALDFLLKPIDVDELKIAVNKAIKQQEESSTNKNIEVLINNLNQKNNQKKIAISTSNGIIVLEIKDIIYCKSDGPYTTIYSTNSKLVSSTHLKEFENLLNEFGFFRIHKSYLVNLSEIKKYKKAEDSHVIVSNGDRVDVSDKKKEELIAKLSTQVIFVH